MPGIDIDMLNTLHLDVLKEIGNIGAGNATTALAQMLNKKIDMGVPKVNILELKNVADVLGGPENLVVGILLDVSGDISGMMMFVLEQRSAHILVNILMERDIHDISEFTELDISALQEIGNILTGSYLSSLAALTKLTIISSIPQMAFDMAGAILSVPAIEFGKVGDRVLFIETEFAEGIDHVTGYFILIPDIDSFEKILTSLGVSL
ncbi:MAG: chemotaxis protein CheC [Epulopiscium sp.]|jgi:chemotaxis protein CheC|uniref:CheY-P-specific phosphatase CheC n=1 Tax=Defluviitalea raffinosedens TaxID=1450156 RepID=A0A7C8LJK4_9FIRM|nr:chemotaxis protein CheC [Defluviitalea raffinosedens]MBZ4669257.1 CheY-P-specific phosphatase CheC [Defluviitaleaceae bacterium]MDK2787172.1 chemotaxis protein CheC [Candidatus Epulonipiscium sp.]KAE9637062.1 CheY-P-specific phosphatase CheC [Defluviitalea raffinosedens]MBM7685182.1 chemotaxis protein CheC [Defluviitalea raffinosedens]HHW67379.1 chemotaxis protein CheC [Candidatus Epulonipiscium sp.]